MNDSHNSAPATTNVPSVIGSRAPTRSISREATWAITAMVKGIGRNATPACSGLYPSWFCTYWVRKKNIAKTEAQNDGVGPGPTAVGEDAHRHQRVRTAQLDEHERDEQRGRRGQWHHGSG